MNCESVERTVELSEQKLKNSDSPLIQLVIGYSEKQYSVTKIIRPEAKVGNLDPVLTMTTLNKTSHGHYPSPSIAMTP